MQPGDTYLPESDVQFPDVFSPCCIIYHLMPAQNFVLAGSPGAGKTHIAIGLDIKAYQRGYNVLFISVPHLLTQIRECQSQKKLHKLELQFE